ncbi:THO complex subunit 2 (Tho2) [Durusdinium trenchii]|uniref:THO complex subunit 2 (Tho2) n=1 Tax=Durusdinium trenchii TaxID=1381693 RepID=A0ABP0QNM2_9DINO
MDCKSSQKAFLNQTILVFGFSKLGVWPTTSGWFSLCSLSCSVVVSHRLSDSLKDKFNDLCCQLERERVISKPILAGGLETETVPSTVCNTALLRKKQNQAKTKARYTVTRFNLLREHNEGYARLMMYVDRLIHLDSDIQGTADQLTKIRESVIDDVMLLIGHSYLCPNRIIAMAIDIYEKLLMEEEEPSKRPAALVSLLRRFSKERITKVAAFLLSSCPPIPAGKDAKQDAKPEQNLRFSQFLAMASLVSQKIIDLRVLWTYLEPNERKIHEAYYMLLRRYEAKLKTVSVVDLSGKSNLDKLKFNSCVKQFNQLLNQKIRLVEAMISINDWQNSCVMLTHLRKICRPCMNHYLRSALCDLLKWIVEPLLPKTSQGGYKKERRFHWGASLQEGEGAAVPLYLRQAKDVEDFLPAAKQVLDQLEFYLHTDNVLMGNLWEVMALSMKDLPASNPVAAASANSAALSNKVLDDKLVAVVFKHLLPAISIAKPCPWLSNMAWNVLKQLTVFQRYTIYSCWETKYNQFMLKYSYEEAKFEAKKILKRVVSSDKSDRDRDRDDPNSYKPSPAFCQLCQTNPIPIVEVMLKDIEIGFNVNMIQPYVDLTQRCSEMMTDVVGYVLARNCERPASETRSGGGTFLNPADGFLSPWLSNFSDFIGRFYKKHPQTNLVGILTVVARRMMNDIPEMKDIAKPGAARQSSKKFKGESLIRVVLEKLMEHMGGLIVVKDLTAEQLVCLAGGPRLRLESVSVGTRPDPQRKERTKKALMDSIVDLGLATALWDCLSKQRLYFLSESFSEVNSGEGALKLLCQLIDGSQDCFLSLIDFLSQASARERYIKLVPPFQQIFGILEPPLAYAALRPGLLPFARGVAHGAKADAKVHTPEEVELQQQLLGIAQKCLPRPIEEDGLSMDFYVTFWRLSLQDIFVPTEGYEKVLNRIQSGQRSFEDSKAKLDRKYSPDTHSREYKAVVRNLQRQKEAYDKVKEEQLQQKLNFEKVLARLELEKGGWFLKKSPEATQAMVAEMIMPRALTSYSDALFCCKFIRLLIRMKTSGFLFLDFYNVWTLMLCMNLRSCTEREAQICGLLLREMMSYVCTLRKSEKAYEQEMKDNPCFHRHHFDSNNVETTIEFAKHADIVRGHSKWEGRIYKVLRQNLESSEDWSDKRNTLLLLSESCDSYPVLERYARGVLQCVENVRDREKANDLKTLANSLAVKLKACSKNWIKVEAKESAKSTPKIAPKPKEAPKDLSKEALKETSKDAKEVSKEVPKEVPKDASKDVSKDAPKDPSKERKEIKEPPKASAKAKEDAKAKPKEGQKKEVKEGKEVKERSDVSTVLRRSTCVSDEAFGQGEAPEEKSKEDREHKRRPEPPRNGGAEERPEKRPRHGETKRRDDDDVVMITPSTSARSINRTVPRNSLSVQSNDRDGRGSSRTVAESRRPPATQYASGRHERPERHR